MTQEGWLERALFGRGVIEEIEPIKEIPSIAESGTKLWRWFIQD
jgi:hypothetical protein